MSTSTDTNSATLALKGVAALPTPPSWATGSVLPPSLVTVLAGYQRTTQMLASAPLQQTLAAVTRTIETNNRAVTDALVQPAFGTMVAEVSERLAVQQKSLVASLAATAKVGLSREFEHVLKFAELANVSRLAAPSLTGQPALTTLLTQVSTALPAQYADTLPWMKLAQSAQLADGFAAISRLANNRQSLLAFRGLSDGATGYLGVQHAVAVAEAADSRPVLHGLSLPVTRPANRYLDSLVERSPRRRVEVAGLLAHGAAGAVIGEALGAVAVDADKRQGFAETARDIVTAPWKLGRELARQDLMNALQEVFPYAVELLEGAWHSIVAPGPAAATTASHCLVEAFDQTLRKLAPEDDVRAWLATSGRSSQQMISPETGRLTRRARIAFILRARSERDRQAILGLEASLSASSNATLGVLQTGKHDGQEVSIQVVRLHAVLIEDILVQLLL